MDPRNVQLGTIRDMIQSLKFHWIYDVMLGSPVSMDEQICFRPVAQKKGGLTIVMMS